MASNKGTPTSTYSSNPGSTFEVVSSTASLQPIAFPTALPPTYAPPATVAFAHSFAPTIIVSTPTLSQSSSSHDQNPQDLSTASKVRRRDEREVYGDILQTLKPLEQLDEEVINQPHSSDRKPKKSNHYGVAASSAEALAKEFQKKAKKVCEGLGNLRKDALPLIVAIEFHHELRDKELECPPPQPEQSLDSIERAAIEFEREMQEESDRERRASQKKGKRTKRQP